MRFAPLVFVLVAACGGPTSPPPPPVAKTGLVAPATVQLLPGESATLASTFRDATGNNVVRPVTWTSSSPSVATVSSAGVVTAISPGTSAITATADLASASATITVLNGTRYTGMPLTSTTDGSGIVRFGSAAYPTLAFVIQMRDSLQRPMQNAAVTYLEPAGANGRVMIVVRRSDTSAVEGFLFATPDSLPGAQRPSRAGARDATTAGLYRGGEVPPAWGQAHFIEPVTISFVLLTYAVIKITVAEVKIILNTAQVEQFYARLNSQTGSGCYSYRELTDLLRARGNIASSSFDIAFSVVTAPAGPTAELVFGKTATTKIATFAAKEWLKLPANSAMNELISLTNSQFAPARTQYGDNRKVRVWFDVQDLSGNAFSKLFAYFAIQPDDPSCSQLTIVSGDRQTWQPGVPLAEPIRVRAIDDRGNPLKNVWVTFTILGPGGGATIENVTDLSGYTSLNWTPVSANNSIRAELTDQASGGVTFMLAGTPGSALQLASSAGAGQSGTVGTALTNPVVVQVTEGGVPKAGVTVQFAAGANSGSVATPNASTDANGKAQTAWTLGTTAGSQTVTATLAGANGSPVTFSATAQPGAAKTIAKVSGDGQSGAASSTLAQSLVAGVTDQYGNAVPNVTVGWAVTGGGGTLLPAGTSQTNVSTNAQGQASVQLRLGSGTGANNNVVTASASGLTGSPVTFLASGTGPASASRASAISVGGSAVCAIALDKKIYCWGKLGGLRPTLVQSSIELQSISAGGNSDHTFVCGLDSSGQAYCWGETCCGIPVLGRADVYVNVLAPTPVATTLRFSSLSSAGLGFVCGISFAQDAYCWGQNDVGQLGDGTTVSRATPVQVVTSVRFTQISATDWHACGVATNGSTYCWGVGGFGVFRSVPTLVPGLPPLQSLRTWNGGACGLTTGGAVYCWGGSSSGGGNYLNPSITQVLPGTIFAKLNEGCGLQSGGAAVCFYGGYPGDGTPRQAGLTTLPGLLFDQLSGDARRTICGLSLNAEAYCWGYNAYAMVGNGIWNDVPVLIRNPVMFP